MVHALQPQGPDQLPYWRNTGITPEEVRGVFRHEPCLLCVLAKRRKEGKRRPQKLKPEQSKSQQPSKLRPLAEPIPESDESYKSQLIEDFKLRPGEILSCDDVPVSPVSIDGYNTFFIFRDTKTRTLFTFTTKDKGEDTYLDRARILQAKVQRASGMGTSANHHHPLRLYEDLQVTQGLELLPRQRLPL